MESSQKLGRCRLELERPKWRGVRKRFPARAEHTEFAVKVLGDPFSHVAFDPLQPPLGDGEVRLTAKEFDLLLFLASNRGRVYTRSQLMDQVWDYSYAADYSTVTVHIRRLREKVEVDPMKPAHIKTVWGVGYKFEE